MLPRLAQSVVRPLVNPWRSVTKLTVAQSIKSSASGNVTKIHHTGASRRFLSQATKVPTWSLLNTIQRQPTLNTLLGTGVQRSWNGVNPTALSTRLTYGSRVLRRFNSTIQPRKVKRRKAQKGRIPVRTGGSQRGNFMAFGDYGLRVKDGVRLTGRQIDAILADVKRRLKPFKGSQIWLRVFPDIPVTSKGNEVRMGKGKGAFEFWACRVPKEKIVLEVRGPGLRPEMAKELLKVAIYKMPVKTVFVDRAEEEKRASALA
ncbi:39S ribosomal protein L16, mitochondrial [Dispira parvispora]|uniref:39S ribosomal protein L16, mitochondrial n=1 Tax=Dispira parvispora TaxID=1520584 RepID=A0A9W8ASK5_9FUNG|nr:39S ribosomal protein L16, mitochondrial [Dispira parvispora]